MPNDAEKDFSIRERVAKALRAAERATGALSRQQYLLRLAGPALEDANRWQTGEHVPACRLYKHIHPLIERMAEDELVSKELAAASAIVYALYYTTWHARGEECAVGAPLPNDICDIGEHTLNECLDNAAQAEAHTPSARI